MLQTATTRARETRWMRLRTWRLPMRPRPATAMSSWIDCEEVAIVMMLKALSRKCGVWEEDASLVDFV